MTEEQLQQATDYLRTNRELWEALGIEDGSQLLAAPLAQGEHNANYRFVHPGTAQELVLRVNYISQLNLEHQSEYEALALKELEPSGRTARCLYVDESRQLIPRSTLVMELLPGRMLDFESEAELAEAARMLADVHSVVPSKGCGLLQPPDALADLVMECENMFAVYKGSALEDPQVTEYAERFFAKTRAQLEASAPVAAECGHIISSEMVSAHFLMNNDGAPGHIVDWEKAILGEATRDVAYFLAPTTTIWDTEFIFSPQQRDAFIEQYWNAVDGRFQRGSFDERFDAYTMGNCLRGVTWSAMTWVLYHDPNHPLKNAKTFEKLKTYLSHDFLELLATEYYRL